MSPEPEPPPRNLATTAMAVVLIFIWVCLQTFRKAMGIPRRRYLQRRAPERDYINAE